VPTTPDALSTVGVTSLSSSEPLPRFGPRADFLQFTSRCARIPAHTGPQHNKKPENSMRHSTSMGVIALATALLVLPAAIAADDQVRLREAEQWRNECAVLRGSDSDAFAYLKKSCMESCGRFMESARRGGRAEHDYQQCERYRTELRWYLDGTLYKEERHYTKLLPPMPTRSAPDRIEVMLQSTLACDGCLQERARFETWVKRHPRVDAVLVPLTWGYSKQEKIDYDAYALVDLFCDVLADKQLAAQVRKHAADTYRTAPLQNKEAVRPLLIAAGADAESLRALDSPAVKAKLRAAEQTTRFARIISAPAYVVDGRTVVRERPGSTRALDVVQFLLEREAGVIGKGD
jgi:hypothetical protein